MTTLAFMLEERSTREMLKGVLPRLLPDGVNVRYVCFEGKQDLQRQLVRKLKGWLTPDTRFIVVQDQDSNDCHLLKDALRKLCKKAGKPNALIRIACRELESFYLGDLAAVGRGLNVRSLAGQQGKRRFREPDRLHNPSQELAQLSQRRYQKLSGSRVIAPHLQLDQSNRSHSFNTLVAGIERVVAELIAASPHGVREEPEHESQTLM